MKKLILGTAGHIDHGKTALVKALAGVDTDRLPEEKRRGITIDLGFAEFVVDEVAFGIVDVPGHEAFIRNMLAGAMGIDVVLLVIAADEGIMPQTREHLAILDLLGVRAGVVALTKCDVVDVEWTQLVAEDVRELLTATSLANAPIIPVSSMTGAGLDALLGAIMNQALTHEARVRADLFRLPIDRVFTVRGTGTVITGTVWSGRVASDALVTVMPAGRRVRVRGVQVHDRPVAEAVAGQRAALALAGVDKDALQRGDVVVGIDAWPTTSMLTLRARVISGTDWRLKMRQRVHVHIGTSEVLGRVVLLDTNELAAGQQGWIQLRLETPVVARVGDRVVLRSYSPVTTIAGGVVAELADRKRTRLSPGDAGLLARVLAGGPDAAAAAIERRSGLGITQAELALLTPLSPDQVRSALTELSAQVVMAADRLFAGDVVRAAIRDLLTKVDALHAQHPLRPTLDRAELRATMRVAPELIELAIDTALSTGDLAGRGSAVKRRDFEPRLTPRQAALRDSVYASIRDGGLAPPTVAEITRANHDAPEVMPLLRLLQQDGVIEAVSEDLYLDAKVLSLAREAMLRILGGRALPATDFRSALPVSRKHLIPLLEYFDRKGITRRDGDLRTVVGASGDK